MVDLTQTTIAKSDILNADDLIRRSITIKITKVSLAAGEQPVAYNYEGDNGKPFMPCKTMRRVIVHCWGSDGNQHVGRLLTLYRDDTVTFGGQQVGGVRISHMSHIEKPITVSLTATKKSKKPFTVQPLKVPEGPGVDDYISDIGNVSTLEGLQHKFSEAQRAYKNDARMLEITAAKDKRKTELTTKGETNESR